MKYLYYTLYIFYTKVIKIQNYDTPHFNISLVLGTLQGLWVFILLNTLKLILTSKLNEASWLIFVLIFLFSILNWYYYKSISKRLIKRINSKTKIKVLRLTTEKKESFFIKRNLGTSS